MQSKVVASCAQQQLYNETEERPSASKTKPAKNKKYEKKPAAPGKPERKLRFSRYLMKKDVVFFFIPAIIKKKRVITKT